MTRTEQLEAVKQSLMIEQAACEDQLGRVFSTREAEALKVRIIQIQQELRELER